MSVGGSCELLLSIRFEPTAALTQVELPLMTQAELKAQSVQQVAKLKHLKHRSPELRQVSSKEASGITDSPTGHPEHQCRNYVLKYQNPGSRSDDSSSGDYEYPH